MEYLVNTPDQLFGSTLISIQNVRRNLNIRLNDRNVNSNLISKMRFRVDVVEDGREDLSQFLDDRIYEHNSILTGNSDGRLFAMRILDEQNVVVAGITGWTWAAVSEITFLWVEEDSRKKGFGTMLLHAAENEIMIRGCHTILLRTYSFQAPEFYKRNGYEVLFVLSDFPQGYKYYNLIKLLTSSKARGAHL